ncbi:hypothetical protein [Nocardia ignorata]|uniref:Uncharacterized protein n=1 Tax=Nocardia ignorata TaxID=145285 RepID=A0A4V3CMI8_NOCIG|nr:hypothetical protein [Nocardia ignorata]TDP29784.1 hypothetical protein DFR75_11248 [Nocardia ignorata]
MENIWKREELPGVTIRCVTEAVGIHLSLEDPDHIDGFVSEIDRTLAPLYPDVALAYAQYVAEST